MNSYKWMRAIKKATCTKCGKGFEVSKGVKLTALHHPDNISASCNKCGVLWLWAKEYKDNGLKAVVENMDVDRFRVEFFDLGDESDPESNSETVYTHLFSNQIKAEKSAQAFVRMEVI